MAIILTEAGLIKETIIKFDEDITENASRKCKPHI